MNCEEARNLIAASSVIADCTSLPSGHLRLQTIFEYPGHEAVDVLVRPHPRADGSIELTDGGMTVAHLLGAGVAIDATRRRKDFVAGACSQFGVSREAGEFVIAVEHSADPHVFTSAVIRLAQASMRIADLSLTFQSRLNSTFDDEVQEGLAALPVRVEQDVPLDGAMGRPVKVDYLLRGPRVAIAGYALTATTKQRAEAQVNKTVRRFHELWSRRDEFEFVTLLNSAVPYWTDADEGVLGELSQVLRFPDEADVLRELVTA